MLIARKFYYSIPKISAELLLRLGRSRYDLNVFLFTLLQSSIILLIDRYLKTKGS